MWWPLPLLSTTLHFLHSTLTLAAKNRAGLPHFRQHSVFGGAIAKFVGEQFSVLPSTKTTLNMSVLERDRPSTLSSTTTAFRRHLVRETLTYTWCRPGLPLTPCFRTTSLPIGDLCSALHIREQHNCGLRGYCTQKVELQCGQIRICLAITGLPHDRQLRFNIIPHLLHDRPQRWHQIAIFNLLD